MKRVKNKEGEEGDKLRWPNDKEGEEGDKLRWPNEYFGFKF